MPWAVWYRDSHDHVHLYVVMSAATAADAACVATREMFTHDICHVDKVVPMNYTA